MRARLHPQQLVAGHDGRPGTPAANVTPWWQSIGIRHAGVTSAGAASGQLGGQVQTISTLPADFRGEKSAAEIAVHPSGRWLYGSNRARDDAAGPPADSIVGYAISPTSGELTLLEYFTDGIVFPRNFGIDPTGTRMYVCNQKGNNIVRVDIDPATGRLRSTDNRTEVPSPVCVVVGSDRR